MVFDITPSLGVKSDVVKYYKVKGSNELRLSKVPIETIDADFNSCREMLIGDIGCDINAFAVNEKARSNPYIIVPLASIPDGKGKFTPLKNSINIQFQSIGAYEFFKKKRNLLILSKLLDYIVGITGVCLSHDDDEVKRRELKVGLAGDIEFKKTQGDFYDAYVEYNTLSPFYTVSPIMASLMLGLVRNCADLAFSEDLKILNRTLFDLISLKDIQSIINTTNDVKARKVYKDIVIPFFDSYDDDDDDFLLLIKKKSQSALQPLIDKGYQSVFNPFHMCKYYRRFNDRYGFDKFCNYINNPRSKHKYDYYRRI